MWNVSRERMNELLNTSRRVHVELLISLAGSVHYDTCTRKKGAVEWFRENPFFLLFSLVSCKLCDVGKDKYE